MVVKGYYANVCQGCSFIGSFFLCGVGLGMIAVGLMTLFNPILKLFGYSLIGLLLIAGGIMAISSGLMSIFGACYEKPVLVTIALSTLILHVLVCVGVVAMCFMNMSKIEAGAREKWKDIPVAWKSTYETTHQCCGLDIIEEASSKKCAFKKPCLKQLTEKDIKAPIKVALILGGAGLMAGAFGLFSIGCFKRKWKPDKPKGPIPSLTERGQVPPSHQPSSAIGGSGGRKKPTIRTPSKGSSRIKRPHK